MSLYNRTAAGVFWNLLEQIGRRGLTAIVTIILARFISPTDFGLIAMLAVFIQIANSLTDSGFMQALIQKQAPEQADFCTVFYANIFLGVVTYLLLFFSAPYIAVFYEEPELEILVRIIGLSIIFNSFRIVQEAELRRRLNFKAFVKASVPGAVISGGVAIVLAVMGFGVWALAVQILISAFVTTVFLWFASGWKPSFIFNITSLKDLFGYGSKLFLSGLLNTIFQNIYVVVIAKLFSAQEAGYYFFAYRIQQLLVHQLTGAVQKVTFPALSSIQDQAEKLKQGFRELMQVLAFIIFPVVLFFASIMLPIFKTALPEIWLPAVPYTQLLLISGLFIPMSAVNLNILKVKRRSDLFLGLEIVKKLFTLVVLLISVKWGIYAILAGKLIGAIVTYIPNAYFSSKLIGYKINDQMSDVGFSMLFSLVLSVPSYFLASILNWNQIVIIVLLGGIQVSAYIAISANINKNPLRIIARAMKI